MFTISWLVSSICCLNAFKETLVNDCWGEPNGVNDCWGDPNGTLTPGLNSWGIDTFRVSEDADGLVCRLCIIEVGMPYGILQPDPKFKTPEVGMAWDVCAAIEAVGMA